MIALQDKPTRAVAAPLDGEPVLYCGHAAALTHLIHLAHGALRFFGADGLAGEAAWVAACPNCFAAAAGDFDNMVLVEGQWRAHPPAVVSP